MLASFALFDGVKLEAGHSSPSEEGVALFDGSHQYAISQSPCIAPLKAQATRRGGHWCSILPFGAALDSGPCKQPIYLPGDVRSPLLNPVNRASFRHALGFALPITLLMAFWDAPHMAGGYKPPLD